MPATPPHAPRRTLSLLLWAVTLVFFLLLSPFASPILWGLVMALVFAPVFRRLLPRLGQRRNLAALLTLLLALVLVVLPLTLLLLALGRETTEVYERVESGQLDPGTYLHRLFDALPEWVRSVLDRLGLVSFNTLKVRISTAVAGGLQTLASGALDVGQGMFRFVAYLFIALYLSFFLIRDGERLASLLRHAIPMASVHKRALFDSFATALRATVKGHLVVAAVQGALGGLAFALLGVAAPLLWAVLMAVLSLVPVVGSSLVWLPVALYLLLTGALLKGLALVVYGVLVIGLVDNLLRPILVGKDTRLPDYVVMMSTLGGIATFGVNGLVLGPAIAALFVAAWKIGFAVRDRHDGVRQHTDRTSGP